MNTGLPRVARTKGVYLRADQRRWWVSSAITSLAIAIGLAHAAFSSGYLLLVDTAWGKRPPSIDVGFYLPISALQRLIVDIVGGAITGKLYVIAVLFLCGFAPMVALRRLPPWARLACGALGVLNPWVYERIVEGQWTVAAAAACLFLCYASLDLVIASPRAIGSILLAASVVAATAFSPPFFLLAFVLIGARLLGERATVTRGIMHSVALGLAAACVTLSYGVVVFLIGRGSVTLRRVATFGSADFKLFRANSTPYGLLPRLVGLEGFWAERALRFRALDHSTPWWPIVALSVLLLSLASVWVDRRQGWLLAVGLLGIGLSASTALPGGTRAATDLSDRVTLIRSLREPEKWLALWLVAVVVLIATLLVTTTASRSIVSEKAGWLFGAVVVALALLLGGWNEFHDVSATLTPASYPSDWAAADAAARTHEQTNDRVVVLPWHEYLSLPFAHNRLVQNPAPVFFSGTVLSSQDPEITAETKPAGPNDLDWASRPSELSSCALANAIKHNDASLVVVLPVLEGPTDVESLLRCGYTAIYGQPGTVSVLSSQEYGS